MMRVLKNWPDLLSAHVLASADKVPFPLPPSSLVGSLSMCMRNEKEEEVEKGKKVEGSEKRLDLFAVALTRQDVSSFRSRGLSRVTKILRRLLRDGREGTARTADDLTGTCLPRLT